MSLQKYLNERKRMDYNTFVRKVERYIRDKGINLNGSIPTKALRDGYESGQYPSLFVRNYIYQLNDGNKKGGFN